MPIMILHRIPLNHGPLPIIINYLSLMFVYMALVIFLDFDHVGVVLGDLVPMFDCLLV